MQFKDPASVKAAIDAMEKAELPRSFNRARIISLFNGNPPYSPEEAQKINLGTNVNTMEAAKIAHAARGVFYQAFVDIENPLQFTLLDAAEGEPDQRQVWENWITTRINCIIDEHPEFQETQREKFGQVAVLGIGPTIWPSRNCVFPISVPLSDIRIPSKTKRSTANLDMFCVRYDCTYAQLTDAMAGSHGYAPDPGWKKDEVEKLIKSTLLNKSEMIGTQQPDMVGWDQEKLVEHIRSNSGYWSSDAVPVLYGWDFYYKNDDGNWDRRILMDLHPQAYIYESDDYSDELKDFFHLQYGDGNNSAPYLYHSVRGLGFMLYALLQLTNQIRCRIIDSTNRDMMMLFRNVGDGDRERIQSYQLKDLAIIPEGLNVMPANERYSGNPALAAQTLGELRGLSAEHSTAFIPDLDSGSREMTAQEVLARRNTAMALTSSVLNMAFSLERQSDYNIVCRIFDNDTKFKREAKAAQIPDQVFKKGYWKVKRNRNIGSGDKTMQQTMAQALVAIIDRLDPEAQRLVLRMYVEAFSDVPGTGFQIVPTVEDKNTTSREKATFAWGTLMDGQDVTISGALNLKEYIDQLIQMLVSRTNQLIQTGQLPSIDTLNGLAMVIQHCQQKLQLIARDPSAREIVKVAGDMLGRVEKQVMDWDSQAQQQGQEQDPEVQKTLMAAQAKAQATVMQADVKGKVTEKAADQKRQHKDLAFIADQKRKAAAAENKSMQDDLTLAADISRQNLETLAAPPEPTKP